MSTDPVQPGKPVFVRTASHADLDNIRELLVETWHATYDAIYGPERVTEITEEWHSVPALEKKLADPQSEFILADDCSQILAMAFAVAHGDHVDLKQLYVRPAARGRGIGAMLLSEIAECFDEAHAIFLEVEEANSAAIAFYDARGFVERERRQECNGVAGFDTILMSKAI